MKDLIGRAATAIGVGASVEDVCSMLRDEGLTNYQAWLTYKAAEIVVKDRAATQFVAA